MPGEMTTEQKSALQMVIKFMISILTGGPGTGKSYTLRAVLEWAKDMGLRIILCAPTGKAAKRMEEATGHPATTIHRALSACMNDDNEFSFTYNEHNPLPCDLLIVDEVSMVTNSLMADLMRAIDTRKTKVLLVGDQGQLPSVGAGAVLRDIIDSGTVPVTRLTKIQRNSGDIVKACHRISNGEYYTPSEKLEPEHGHNLRHVECRSMEQVLSAIKHIVTQRIHTRGYDPVWDVQVLSPVNDRTILSCNSINSMLQDVLNPIEDEKGFMFRAYDKVIQTKNTKINSVDGGETYIVNGDIGQLLEVIPDEKKMMVKFFNPDRTVYIPKNDNNLLLAYCITTHRMQGSEAPVVIIPIHEAFSFFLSRSWIYTAISRAKEICITVGQFSAIEKAIDMNRPLERKTMLKEKLMDRMIEEAEI